MITIDRKSLSAMMSVTRIAAPSSPATSRALIVAADGHITVTCTDGTLTLSQSGECDGDLSLLVDARRLKAFVSSGKTGSVTIERDGENAKLKAGRARATFATMPVSDFPSPDAMVDVIATIRMEGSALVDAVTQSIHSAARNDTRTFLNGVHLRAKDGSLTVEASNGSKGSVVSISDESGSDMSIIVPVRAAAEIAKLPPGIVRMSTDNSSLRIEQGDTVMLTRLIDSRYPNMQAGFKPTDAKAIVSRDAMVAALACAGVTDDAGGAGGGSYRRVEIATADGVMTVQSVSKTGDSASDELPVETDGGDLDVMLDPGLLSGVLGSMSGDTVTIGWAVGEDVRQVILSDGRGARHVIMLMLR